MSNIFIFRSIIFFARNFTSKSISLIHFLLSNFLIINVNLEIIITTLHIRIFAKTFSNFRSSPSSYSPLPFGGEGGGKRDVNDWGINHIACQSYCRVSLSPQLMTLLYRGREERPDRFKHRI